MKKRPMARRLYLLSLVLLVMTVPWPFLNTQDEVILGFPLWACYSLGMTVLFAGVMAALLPICWGPFADDEGDVDGPH